VDRLEMAFQASVYETQGYGRLDEFFATTDAVLEDPALREILGDLMKLRA